MSHHPSRNLQNAEGPHSIVITVGNMPYLMATEPSHAAARAVGERWERLLYQKLGDNRGLGWRYEITITPVSGEQSSRRSALSSHLGSHHDSQRASQLQLENRQYGSSSASSHSSRTTGNRPSPHGASARHGSSPPSSSRGGASLRHAGHSQSQGQRRHSYIPSSLQARSPQIGPYGHCASSRGQAHGHGHGPSPLDNAHRSRR